ncbi:GmrSD restriction endonuclease domain-containing protein [Shewanella sp. JL219SE-S6]
MQQSIKAQDRSLGDWYNAIENGRVKLPRFQRYEAWDKRRIQSLFDTALNNLPIGVALILQVEGSTEPFVSRYISHAEPKHPEPVTQHLLDGQQRLTAFGERYITVMSGILTLPTLPSSISQRMKRLRHSSPAV